MRALRAAAIATCISSIAPAHAEDRVAAKQAFDEWTLDWEAPYATPCVDCAALVQGSITTRVMRGGGLFSGASPTIRTANRSGQPPALRGVNAGIRCARPL